VTEPRAPSLPAAPRATAPEPRLSTQFLLTGGLLLLVAMIGAGLAVTHFVAEATINHTAASSAVFVQSLVSPFADELGRQNSLSPASLSRLDELMAGPAISERFPYLEIWLRDGTVAYSNSPEIIGRKFAPPAALGEAFGGEVVSDFTDLQTAEHRSRGFEAAFLEVYTPVLASSGEIVAVAEIHEITQPLQEGLARIRLISWLAVAGSTLVIMAGLYGVVRRGTRTIERQQAALVIRAAEAEQLARANRALGERLRNASARTAEIHENTIRRLGADLHDGPAQLVGFAQLKLDEFAAAPNPGTRKRLREMIRTALAEAIHEIRAIASGALLPELHALTLSQVVELAVHAHVARTGAQVALDIVAITADVADAARACVYRFVQEGLNNAYRHAAGGGCTVSCSLDGNWLGITVSSRGRTPPAARDEAAGPRLGLIGMRERIESLGGTLTLETDDRGRTRVTMSIELQGGLLADEQDQGRDH
jgi:signal transduction histidine kinase